jgi:replicative DNA helicase
MIEDIFEQEALLIGSILVNPERLDDTNLTADDFTNPEHKTYFSCILSCATNKDEMLNVFSVREKFRNETGTTADNLLDYSVRGASVSSYFFESYSNRIKKQSLTNKAFKITSDLIENLNQGNTDFISGAVSKLMNIDKSDAKYDHSFGDVSVMVVDALDAAYKGETGAVKTGFSGIDEQLGGFYPSDLIIVPARPAMGKTAFMVNSFLRCSGKVGVISGEQGAEQIGVRSVCIEGKVNHQNFRRGEINDTEQNSIDRAVLRFKEMGGRIYDKPSPTMMDIEKVSRKWVYKYGVNIIYIDYAQRISHENKKMNRYEQMSDIAMRLKELARTLNVPVIALAQVNRQCEQRDDKRPKMGDIADASAFEKEADVIFTLYRDEVYNEDTQYRGVIEANFVKNRHGAIGRVDLTWNSQYMNINDFNGYEYHQESVPQQEQGGFSSYGN